jgi:hypothetical protein
MVVGQQIDLGFGMASPIGVGSTPGVGTALIAARDAEVRPIGDRIEGLPVAADHGFLELASRKAWRGPTAKAAGST